MVAFLTTTVTLLCDGRRRLTVLQPPMSPPGLLEAAQVPPSMQGSLSLGVVSQCLAAWDVVGKGPGDPTTLCPPWLPRTCCVGHTAT